MIDPELRRYYEDRFSMMTSPGWQDLVEDMQKLADQYSDIRNCTEQAKLDFRKGQVDILDYIISLKAMSEQAWEEINETNV